MKIINNKQESKAKLNRDVDSSITLQRVCCFEYSIHFRKSCAFDGSSHLEISHKRRKIRSPAITNNKLNSYRARSFSSSDATVSRRPKPSILRPEKREYRHTLQGSARPFASPTGFSPWK